MRETSRVGFSERARRTVVIPAGKLTIMQAIKRSYKLSRRELSYSFLNATFQPVVLLSFDNASGQGQRYWRNRRSNLANDLGQRSRVGWVRWLVRLQLVHGPLV